LLITPTVPSLIASSDNAAELNINGLSQHAAVDQVTDAISTLHPFYYLSRHLGVHTGSGETLQQLGDLMKTTFTF